MTGFGVWVFSVFMAANLPQHEDYCQISAQV